MLTQTACRQCSQFVNSLSARETEMLKTFAAMPWATNLELAQHLSISINTVKTYWQRIYRTVGAEGRSDCMAICLEAGIVEQEEFRTRRDYRH